MTEAEIYEFDLHGVIIYRNLISNDDVRHMNAIIDRSQEGKDPSQHFSFQFLDLDPCFLELMAHPQTIQIIRTMVGEWLRLDHTYGLQMTLDTMERCKDIHPNLHGGPRTDHGEHQYQVVNGKMHNGLIVVMYALEDVRPGDGGFACVPGSHKGNFAYKPSLDSHLVVNPPLRAGDMLIFTEALIHGTKPWISTRRRRSLLYKYSPGHSAWGDASGLEQYRQMARTDLERDLLRPPYVGGRTPLQFPEDELILP